MPEIPAGASGDVRLHISYTYDPFEVLSTTIYSVSKTLVYYLLPLAEPVMNLKFFLRPFLRP